MKHVPGNLTNTYFQTKKMITGQHVFCRRVMMSDFGLISPYSKHRLHLPFLQNSLFRYGMLALNPVFCRLTPIESWITSRTIVKSFVKRVESRQDRWTMGWAKHKTALRDLFIQPEFSKRNNPLHKENHADSFKKTMVHSTSSISKRDRSTLRKIVSKNHPDSFSSDGSWWPGSNKLGITWSWPRSFCSFSCSCSCPSCYSPLLCVLDRLATATINQLAALTRVTALHHFALGLQGKDQRGTACWQARDRVEPRRRKDGAADQKQRDDGWRIWLEQKLGSSAGSGIQFWGQHFAEWEVGDERGTCMPKSTTTMSLSWSVKRYRMFSGLLHWSKERESGGRTWGRSGRCCGGVVDAVKKEVCARLECDLRCTSRLKEK